VARTDKAGHGNRVRNVDEHRSLPVIALFPLAAHGGPLWEPLCYAQIGGLCVATVITLLLVPVLYAIFVLDLKWVKWGDPPAEEHEEAQAAVHTIAEARTA
jgi:hypothetical protein